MAAKTYDLVDDVAIEQGATYTFRINLSVTGQSTYFNGSTTRGQIRRTYSDSDILATFTCTNSSNPVTYVDVQLTATQTAALPVTPAANYKKRDSLYCYDIECQLASGTVIRLLQGKVEVSPEVTK